MDESALRLERLARILNDGSIRREASPSDAAQAHLDSLRLDRIQRLTREIDTRAGLETDELDCVAMRLLVEEYLAALGHLRAVARQCGRRMEGAPTVLKDIRRLVHQHQARQEKRFAVTEPSD